MTHLKPLYVGVGITFPLLIVGHFMSSPLIILFALAAFETFEINEP